MLLPFSSDFEDDAVGALDVSVGMAKVGLPVDGAGAGREALVKLKLEKGFAAPAAGAKGAAPGSGGAVKDKEDSAALGLFHLLI
jgi:hypothetical protein